MNKSHAYSNLIYAKVYGHIWQATEARMVALDKEGMELEVTVPDGVQRLRIPFEHRLHDEGEAQQTLVEMSFKARDILAQHVQKNGWGCVHPSLFVVACRGKKHIWMR